MKTYFTGKTGWQHWKRVLFGSDYVALESPNGTLVVPNMPTSRANQNINGEYFLGWTRVRALSYDDAVANAEDAHEQDKFLGWL